ncbi:MAG TPA: SagB/ThcOx family dehydrogenase [Candidatus Bathyarchaeia archaeon]|nr:SagB/ThcOx family dehydrogenase [Candidatus Bathyarchaeia archaeon]
MPTKTIIIGVIVALVVVTAMAITFSVLIQHAPKPVEHIKTNDSQRIGIGERIKLPEPRYTSNTSVEEALSQRRSIRAYSGETLTIEDVSQLLWAAQGITSAGGGRTAPSAGALYPLELYLVVGDVEGIDKGVYKYILEEHELEKVKDGDIRAELADAALGQACVRDAAIDIVFTAVYERTTGKYRERGIRYVQMEAGHAAQNIYLQAVALDLGTVVIGAFVDGEVKEIMKMQEQETPLYIMPVGRKG